MQRVEKNNTIIRIVITQSALQDKIERMDTFHYQLFMLRLRFSSRRQHPHEQVSRLEAIEG